MDALLSDPAVREYLSLVRLQVLTPLSLLINIATVLVCSVLVNPSIHGILRLYPTSISPNPPMIDVYVILIWIGQIGYCLLLVLASKPETKKTLVQAVGLPLVLANWVMAGWAIAFVFRWFLVATILQALLLLLLVYSNTVLIIYHPPTSARPIDTALIHAPLRFFLLFPLALAFPYSLFVTLGLAYIPDTPDYAAHPWPGLAVVLATNLLALAVVTLHRDAVWCVAATWLCVSMWTARPKPVSVYVTVILFTALHPLALVAALLHRRFSLRDNGAIALPPDDMPEEPRPPRELDAEALWG